MNLQSRVIRIPLCTVHHWKQLYPFLANRHLAVNICTVLPLLETEWIKHPTTTTTTTLLLPLSPDYSLSTTTSLFVFDLELQALLATGVQCLRL